MKTKPVKAAPMEARISYDLERDLSILVLDWSHAGQAALREKIRRAVGFYLENHHYPSDKPYGGCADAILAALAPAKRKGRGKNTWANADSARLDFLEAKDHWGWGLSCWNVDDETNNGWTYGRLFEEPTYTGKTARDAIDAAQAAAKST